MHAAVEITKKNEAHQISRGECLGTKTPLFKRKNASSHRIKKSHFPSRPHLNILNERTNERTEEIALPSEHR